MKKGWGIWIMAFLLTSLVCGCVNPKITTDSNMHMGGGEAIKDAEIKTIILPDYLSEEGNKIVLDCENANVEEAIGFFDGFREKYVAKDDVIRFDYRKYVAMNDYCGFTRIGKRQVSKEISVEEIYTDFEICSSRLRERPSGDTVLNILPIYYYIFEEKGGNLTIEDKNIVLITDKICLRNTRFERRFKNIRIEADTLENLEAKINEYGQTISGKEIQVDKIGDKVSYYVETTDKQETESEEYKIIKSILFDKLPNTKYVKIKIDWNASQAQEDEE